MKSRMASSAYGILSGRRFTHTLALEFGGLFPATTEKLTMNTFIHGCDAHAPNGCESEKSPPE